MQKEYRGVENTETLQEYKELRNNGIRGNILGRNADLMRICRFSVRWVCQPLVLSQSFCLETKVQSKDPTNVSFLLLILNKG